MMEVPYHYQFRIIVIGDTMVGKSSLLKTFSEGHFGEMEPTVGVDFFSKIIRIQPKHLKSAQNSRPQSNSPAAYNNDSTSTNRLDENIIVKLQIWDTAGQERFKSIVTSYYRNSVGIVLVYDITNRESFEHLIDWFTEARKHVEPSPSPSLSPITQNTPSLSNSYNNYPLTSTPNASPASKKNSTNSNHNQYNSKSNSNHRSGNNSSLSHFSNSNNNRNNSNDLDSSANLSFKSLNETSRFRQSQVPNENFKMAYLILGCKTDLESQRQVSYEEGQAFADAYGFKFIETSSKLHYNVNQTFQILAEEIYDKISECGRLNRLHRTSSGDHLTFDGAPSQVNEGIRLGPLIENSRRYGDATRVRLLEAQPVSGYLGGCC